MNSNTCRTRIPVIVILIATFSLLAALPGMCELEGIKPDPEARKALSIRLPAQVNPNDVILLVGAYGQGMSVGHVRTEEKVFEYAYELPAWTKSVKVLAYYPGARISTAEIPADDASLAKPFAPAFERLPMVRLTIKLVDTGGRPIVGQQVYLAQDLGAMEYFGYMDGPVWRGHEFSGRNWRAGTGGASVTDAAGEIRFQVASLLDDPFYTQAGIKEPGFSLSIPSPKVIDGNMVWFPTPWAIPAQKKYSKPFVVTMTYYGRIAAHLSRQFLQENGVPEEALQPGTGGRSRVSLSAELPSGSGAGMSLSQEGTAAIENLRPGAYTLTLQVYPQKGGLLEKSIPVGKDVLVGERQTVTIER